MYSSAPLNLYLINEIFFFKRQPLHLENASRSHLKTSLKKERNVYTKKVSACIPYSQNEPETVPRVGFFTDVLLLPERTIN